MFLPEPPKRGKRVPPDPITVREIYIDESSQTKHAYLVIGGFIVNATYSDLLRERLWEARLPDLPGGEIGWTKVSKSKVAAYKRFVDVFFAGLDDHSTLDAHIIIVKTSKINDKEFNSGSRDAGFNKEIYQLCLKFWRLYRSVVFHVYPDERETATSLEDLRQILNAGCRKKGSLEDWPFRRIQFRNSKKDQCIQLIDVLIGAVAYKLNGHYDAPDAASHKRELCDHVLKRAKIRDVMHDTAKAGKFTLWHRQLKNVPRP